MTLPRHREWLNDRNELARIVNAEAGKFLSTEQTDALCGGINALEHRIFGTPPQTADELQAVMVLALQVTAEGNELAMETAAKIVADAKAVILLGSLDSAWESIRTQFSEGAAA